MKTLDIKSICGYLPYGLKMQWESELDFTLLISTLTGDNLNFQIERKGKPILRPLSDLVKSISHNGETFVPIEWFEIGDNNNKSKEYDYGNVRVRDLLDVTSFHNAPDLDYLPFGVVTKLMEWKFNVFNLDTSLWVDVNTLERNPYE